MSTMPALASKGEKSKQKFQSLDINSLYRSSRGENLEKQQQKNTIQYKHGMQSLGKVPNARRAPANLPSLKSEHSGTDASVPLVPPGGPGWGKQDSTSTTSSTSQTTTTTTASTPNTTQPSAPQLSSHQAAIALPVTTTIIPPAAGGKVATVAPPPPPPSSAPPAVNVGVVNDKSWSAVMSGPDHPGHHHHPPPYQSPQFQHEFPSLSVGDGGGGGGTATAVAAGAATTDGRGQYAPGLSLRPQTEGSWIQGGSRPPGVVDCPPRSSSVPSGAPPQLAAQVGQQQPVPPQFRAVMPTFMYKGSFAGGQQQQQGNGNQAPVNNGRGGGAGRPDNRQMPLRMAELEDVMPRPIIKEEDLTRMDEIERDLGWTCQDDIDYNQKLAFSDDESSGSNNNVSAAAPKSHSVKAQHQQPKEQHHHHQEHENNGHPQDTQQQQSRNWNSAPPPPVVTRQRSSEEDVWKQRRNQHNKDLELTVQRAKQRKEEEEKRFNEATKQGAAKKLQELEEKMSKRNREEEGAGTINPSVVPPKPIVPTENIPLPDFQRDKERERENRSRTPNDSANSVEDKSSFRQLTQIEGKSLAGRGGAGNNNAKHPKGSERDARERDRDREMREQNGHNYRYFQLPPRFQKQRNSGPSTGLQQGHYPQSEGGSGGGNKWGGQGAQSRGPSNRPDTPERGDIGPVDDGRDYKRQSSEDSHRSGSQTHHGDSSHSHRGQDHEYGGRNRGRDEDKWAAAAAAKDKERKQDEEWQRRDKERHERPQRPDSRDSRASRESRHSRDSAEPKDHIGSWAESAFEPTYEEKRREHLRGDDRRQVPGPITKDRIEADDMRVEKRGLTQLKRGQLPDKKTGDKRDDGGDKQKDAVDSGPKAWADALSPNTVDPENPKFMEVFEKKSGEMQQGDAAAKKSDGEAKDKDDKKGRVRGSYPTSNKSWGGSSEFHRSGWSKRPPPPSRGARSGGRHDFHGTDSEGSMDDADHKRSTVKKSDKEDKNKEIRQHDQKSDQQRRYDSARSGGDPSKRDSSYVPRGEPSRHGRGGGGGGGGGGNFRGGGRGGGMSRRIDAYGPPPAKSPFGHHDDDKKREESSAENQSVPLDDKAKQNQQALSAGIGAGARKESAQGHFKADDKSKGRKPEARPVGKAKAKEGGDNVDSNSDNSDDKSGRRGGKISASSSRSSLSSGPIRRNNNGPPPRLAGQDKKPFTARGDAAAIPRQNSSGTLRSSKKEDDSTTVPKKDGDSDDGDEKIQADSDGFQEVKSKKMAKERQKSIDDKPAGIGGASKIGPASTKSDVAPAKSLDRGSTKTKVGPSAQLTQQQISNIPPLMATPVNPPPVLPQQQSSGLGLNGSKGQFERPRQAKLAPRFAKQREVNRLQKAQLQHQGICDVSDMNKVNQNLNVYGMKDAGPIVNAWDKSLGAQLGDAMLGGDCKGLEQVAAPGQSSATSPNAESKVIGKVPLQDKALLDGTTPPVNTIIFENTNFKSAPGSRHPRGDKPRSKMDEGIDASVLGFNKPIGDLLGKPDKQSPDSIQIPLSLKEESADIKLDFFETELSHLTDDKSSSSSKNLCMTRSIHTITTSSNNAISTADALNFKIQSVKKMWETPGGPDDPNSSSSSFASSFVDPNALVDPNSFVKGAETADDVVNEGYSPSPNHGGVPNSSTTNVCKVKPTQQVSGGGQAVLNSSGHQQHSGIMGPSLMGNPLSPPPLQGVIGTGVNLAQPPQQYGGNQHIGYQAGLGGSNQYSIPAIPSPPTVMYNSTQQLQQTPGLFGPFQIDQSGMLGGQARSQYSQYPNHYGLGQTASSPYSAQSVYLPPNPQAHPPPTAQAPPPDLYQNLGNFRLSATGHFGQNQQLNNPTTVLISSTSNSLMSASVKPSQQMSQISAIGTKAGGVGQAYQQQSQQNQQVYMTYDPSMQAANYMPNAAAMQRGPTGPVQNNVVPGLQPSSSYYSGSTGQTGYFPQQASSTIQSAQLQQHQAGGYGLQGNVLGTHSQSHNSAGLQSFNSHFLSTPMQLAAAYTAQQYRSSMQTPYNMKGMSGDQTGRQQLKSPSSQEMLSSVFNSGSQMSSSPKLRQNAKQPPQQPSPTAQHKYLYQTVNNQQSGNRFPNPIQRPVNFQQQNMGSMHQQNNSSSNPKHRPNNTNNGSNKGPSRQQQQYYHHSNSLSSQNEKVVADSNNGGGKLSEVSSGSADKSPGVVASVAGAAPSANSTTPEISKDTIASIEETALKD